MAQKSSIEWTDATWNPVTGCTKLSAGCDNCYAATLANRLLADIYLAKRPVAATPEAEADPFSLRLWPERLNDPIDWSKPRQIFVNSMSDLFHRDVPEEYIRSVFEVMLVADWHTYQVLTKRPARASGFVARNPDLFADGEVPAHIWLGTSVENQDVAYRIEHLRRVPAKTRFLSCEPLIGPIRTIDLTEIHWVIVGGESGIERRPVDPAWVRTLRDICLEADVPFFFKQWGGRTPKAGGRDLDGREWSQMPMRQLQVA